MSQIAVVGLGKLGACTAAAFAAAGHVVQGFDQDAAVRGALARGEAPVVEPGLGEWIARAGSRLTVADSIVEAVCGAEATMIVVPTPSSTRGDFSLAAVDGAVRGVGAALAGTAARHVVVITSTVSPGSCDGAIRRALEESSGLRVGEGVGLCYNPEFIALGTVIHDFLHPDVVLIGESDGRSGELVAQLHRTTCRNDPPIARMSLASAELAKIALNTFVTTKISFANLLGEICERMPGADVDEVCGALGLDARVGTKCLTAGLGYGGPCFPRDNAALAAAARAVGATAPIAEATDAVNARVVARIAAAVVDNARAPARVAVLGLAYKPGTRILERSHGVDLVRALVSRGYDVLGWDSHPLARAAARSELAEVRVVDSLDEALTSSQVVVVADRELGSSVAEWMVVGNPVPANMRVLVDCWRGVPPACVPANIRHVRIGVGTVRAGGDDALLRRCA